MNETVSYINKYSSNIIFYWTKYIIKFEAFHYKHSCKNNSKNIEKNYYWKWKFGMNGNYIGNSVFFFKNTLNLH